jgi:hypothetical protein
METSPSVAEVPHPGRFSGDFAYWRCSVCYHFRFLKNINVSFWQTYSKPTSSSDLISSVFSAILTVNWSLAPASKSVCSMFM